MLSPLALIPTYSCCAAFNTEVLISDVSCIQIQWVTNKPAMLIYNLNIYPITSIIIRLSSEFLVSTVLRTY
jgi:hypothetical protein